MARKRDAEFNLPDLRRLKDLTDKIGPQDAQTLRNAWRAIVRSHALLNRPVYTVPTEGELTAAPKPL